MNNKKYHSRSDIKRIILLITLTDGMIPAIKKMKVDICSEEFTKRNLSDADYVDALYHTFFNRDAYPIGKDTWMNSLAKGEGRIQPISCQCQKLCAERLYKSPWKKR